jgi:ribose transport system substrate-binding protein
MKKLFKGFLFLTLLMVVLAGCSTKAPSSSSVKDSAKEKKDDQLKIGLSISTLNNPFFVSLKEGAEKEAKSQGTEIITVDAQNDSAKQVSDIEDLIQKMVRSSSTR